jgi:hypothetical protein
MLLDTEKVIEKVVWMCSMYVGWSLLPFTCTFRASRIRSVIALRTSLRPFKKIGVLKIALLAFADLKILDSRLADDGKTTIQTATKSH